MDNPAIRRICDKCVNCCPSGFLTFRIRTSHTHALATDCNYCGRAYPSILVRYRFTNQHNLGQWSKVAYFLHYHYTPHSTEQGIFAKEQGISTPEQGI